MSYVGKTCLAPRLGSKGSGQHAALKEIEAACFRM